MPTHPRDQSAQTRSHQTNVENVEDASGKVKDDRLEADRMNSNAAPCGKNRAGMPPKEAQPTKK
eukprot:CAMPEP_0194772610 /NCGR_PEP_ID=MMETSP0323_2-20130528/52500_1 /TAXON_ID=2866 ORGANISM="Crypthecodinium cohnii, Strain Seligo" /NCGR_SAMPLE_ID=MMETSP0323_2 /ASSEMBLY_ACC=CAM_ASM_000346 /LENGTH=63 /DNA_ID=CAMNT_0039707215 /DNA_START=56 /DNA_END=244 /DNA_ORIENTATION=-